MQLYFSESPWKPGNDESVQIRVLNARLFTALETKGWKLYATVTRRTGRAGKNQLDARYFVRKGQDRGIRDGTEERRIILPMAIMESDVGVGLGAWFPFRENLKWPDACD